MQADKSLTKILMPHNS